jgi:hypothetical protein
MRQIIQRADEAHWMTLKAAPHLLAQSFMPIRKGRRGHSGMFHVEHFGKSGAI